MQSCCYDEYEKVMRVLMIFIPERLPEQHSFDKFIFSSATFDLFIYSIFTLNWVFSSFFYPLSSLLDFWTCACGMLLLNSLS